MHRPIQQMQQESDASCVAQWWKVVERQLDDFRADFLTNCFWVGFVTRRVKETVSRFNVRTVHFLLLNYAPPSLIFLFFH